MRKIRRGKDIKIEWAILTNGEIVSLSGRDLRLVVNSPMGEKNEMSFTVSGNTVSATFTSKDDTRLGAYSLTLWENYGKDGQTAVDACGAFTLVPTTCAEGGQDEGLDTETVELSGNIELFTSGESGGGGIPDAPFDGKTYGRNNGAWVVVEGGSEDFVTDEELTQTLQDYAKKADVPDVSGLLSKTEAIETYQPKGDYLTEIPQEYVTDEELTTKLNAYALKESIPDVSGLATKEELASKADTTAIPTKVSQLTNDSGYLTAIPDEYVTDTELTQALEGYATTEDIPDTSQLATKTELGNKLDASVYNSEKVSFATKDEIGDIETILENIIGS